LFIAKHGKWVSKGKKLRRKLVFNLNMHEMIVSMFASSSKVILGLEIKYKIIST
jgi:hypothetical protein